MAFENGVVPEDWRSAVIVPLYKEKGMNVTTIEVLACQVWLEKYMWGSQQRTEGLIDDEHGGFRAGRGYVNQIFTLKQIVYVGFIDLEKANNRVNTEVLQQELRMYDVEGKLLSGIKSMYMIIQLLLQ